MGEWGFVTKCEVGLQTFLQDCLSEHKSYGDLLYKLRRIVDFLIFFRNN